MKRYIILLTMSLTLAFWGCGKKGSPTTPVDNPPAAVSLGLETVSSTSASLAWGRSVEGDFSSYRLYRSRTSGVSDQSMLLASFGSAGDTAYIDTTLSPHHNYYYALYVVDVGGNKARSNEVQAATTGLAGLTLGMEPRIITVSQGSVLAVDVWVESVADLFGASFELCFNGSVLQVESVAAGSFLGTDVMFFNIIEGDTASVAVTRKAGAGGVSGYGTLAVVYFRAIGPGSADITFSNLLALKREDGTMVNGFYGMDIWRAKVTVQ